MWLAYTSLYCTSQRIGEDWITDLMKLRDLLPLAEDTQFMREVHRVKKVRESLPLPQPSLVCRPLLKFSVALKSWKWPGDEAMI